MSPLTKLFVVFHVILSLLLTAGLVVFVNRVENFKLSAEKANDALQVEQKRSEAAIADANALKQVAEKAAQQAGSALAAVKAQLDSAQQQIADKDVKIAELNSNNVMAAANLARLTEGLTASENQKALQLAMITDLRTSGDKLTKEKADLNIVVSDLTNKLEATERDRRYYAEQLSQANNVRSGLENQLKGLGYSPTELAAAATKVGPPINGVVREVRPIGGVPYATISVGSADSVTKGMEFKVIDRSRGDFLGVLTVDTVEPNEATGRLVGPRVGEITRGSEVRTQL